MKKKITMIIIVLSYLFSGINVIVYDCVSSIHVLAVGIILSLMIPMSMIDTRNNTRGYCIATILVLFIPSSCVLLWNNIRYWGIVLGEALFYPIAVYGFIYFYRKPVMKRKTDGIKQAKNNPSPKKRG